MTKPSRVPPFSKEDMENELREILFVQASQIAHIGSDSAAREFLGFVYDFDPGCFHPTPEVLAGVDLKRFAAWGYLGTGYDFAFQVGNFWGFSEGDNLDLITFSHGISPCACYGDQNPYLAPESLCRHVVDMALGRWKLECDDERDLTIRELALLSGMTEAAVRNSLSNEQIRTRGKPAALAPDIALSWLQGRKGFIPTQKEESEKSFWAVHTRSLLSAPHFATGMETVLRELSLVPETLANSAQVPLEMIQALLSGETFYQDIEALRRIAKCLKVDEPYFAGQAIEALLRANDS